jgi:hypothetical protein
VVSVVLVLAASLMVGCGTSERASGDSRGNSGAQGCLLSREVMRVAEDVVRVERPAPAAAARFYAYVASAYEEALENGSQVAAVRTAGELIGVLYPAQAQGTRRELASLADRACSGPGDAGAPADAGVLATYLARSRTDGSELIWDGRVPEGVGVWSSEGIEPATPRAGDWRRWAVRGEFTVPPPPRYGSRQDQEQLSKVEAAVAARDGGQVAKVNFWGGTPGTDTPGGIWQNQLFAVLGPDLDDQAVQADRTYARAQAMLAQVIADAFMECWKVKYTYWTARPSMRIPDLDLAMPDPPFPSYPSGHAVVSAAAAEVLAVMAPRHAAEWRRMSSDAADSRLHGGVHFEIDTVEGTRLGTAVGREFATRSGLEALTE